MCRYRIGAGGGRRLQDVLQLNMYICIYLAVFFSALVNFDIYMCLMILMSPSLLPYLLEMELVRKEREREKDSGFGLCTAATTLSPESKTHNIHHKLKKGEKRMN